MKPPALLVSPSIGTGYDFPYEDCQYQIIGKLPFPDTRSAVMKERCKEDKEFQHYFTMMQLVQMCGRGMRAEDDICENLIIDDNFIWMINRYGYFAPEWFLQAIVKSNIIPKPIEVR